MQLILRLFTAFSFSCSYNSYGFQEEDDVVSPVILCLCLCARALARVCVRAPACVCVCARARVCECLKICSECLNRGARKGLNTRSITLISHLAYYITTNSVMYTGHSVLFG